MENVDHWCHRTIFPVAIAARPLGGIRQPRGCEIATTELVQNCG